MCRILPTYRSVWAQINSWPHGFSTRFMRASYARNALAEDPAQGLQRLAVQLVRVGVPPQLALEGQAVVVDVAGFAQVLETLRGVGAAEAGLLDAAPRRL